VRDWERCDLAISAKPWQSRRVVAKAQGAEVREGGDAQRFAVNTMGPCRICVGDAGAVVAEEEDSAHFERAGGATGERGWGESKKTFNRMAATQNMCTACGASGGTWPGSLSAICLLC